MIDLGLADVLGANWLFFWKTTANSNPTNAVTPTTVDANTLNASASSVDMLSDYCLFFDSYNNILFSTGCMLDVLPD